MKGFNFDEALDKMFDRNYFGMMMVETGEADAFITGVYTKYTDTITVAKEVIGIRDGFSPLELCISLIQKKALIS